MEANIGEIIRRVRTTRGQGGEQVRGGGEGRGEVGQGKSRGLVYWPCLPPFSDLDTSVLPDCFSMYRTCFIIKTYWIGTVSELSPAHESSSVVSLNWLDNWFNQIWAAILLQVSSGYFENESWCVTVNAVLLVQSFALYFHHEKDLSLKPF